MYYFYNTSIINVSITNLLSVLIRNLLFWFDREVSLTVTLIIIINNVHSEEQLDKVNFTIKYGINPNMFFFRIRILLLKLFS